MSRGASAWRDCRIPVDPIEPVATESLRRPVGRDRVLLIDQIGEMLMRSRCLRAAVHDPVRDGASFLATVGGRPAQSELGMPVPSL